MPRWRANAHLRISGTIAGRILRQKAVTNSKAKFHGADDDLVSRTSISSSEMPPTPLPPVRTATVKNLGRQNNFQELYDLNTSQTCKQRHVS